MFLLGKQQGFYVLAYRIMQLLTDSAALFFLYAYCFFNKLPVVFKVFTGFNVVNQNHHKNDKGGKGKHNKKDKKRGVKTEGGC